MSKVAVVIRHLNNCRPVVSAVITTDNAVDYIDDKERYLKSKAEDHISIFKKDFVEFEDAKFYVDIVESS